MRIRPKYLRYVAGLLACLASFGAGLAQAADEPIVFATPPTQTVEQTTKMYGPIVDFLSQVTGRAVMLATPDSFLAYTNNMRAGKYDLLFDGPHFVGWRIERLRHTALARLPGEIRFVVVVRDDAGIDKITDLAGKKVCAFASPNLLTLGFLDLFPNPARIPAMSNVKTAKAALQCVQHGEAQAAVFRDVFWNKRQPAERHGLHEIYHSKQPWPHRTFTIAKDADPALRAKIKAALLSDAGTRAARKVLARYRAKHFIPAKDEDYRGLGKLLTPVWGFY